MADVAIVSSEFIAGAPFLIKKYVLTMDTGALTITHGGPGIPDIAFIQCAITSPGGKASSVYSLTATTCVVDGEATGGTGDAVLYLIWFGQATDGLNSP
jgi:hypothetical protein